VTTFGWDAEHRLRTAALPGNSYPITFGYAPDGLRISKEETRFFGFSTYNVREEYQWDGDEVLQWTRSGSGHFFVRGPDLVKSLGTIGPIPGSGQSFPPQFVSRYYYQDALSTVQTIGQAGIGHLGYNIDAWATPQPAAPSSPTCTSAASATGTSVSTTSAPAGMTPVRRGGCRSIR
jgi:hypothetical protein